jgi:HlyD family secretion protein
MKIQKQKTQADSNNTRKRSRQEAVQRLSSPEQLDQLVEVVERKAWLPLGTIGFLLIVALLWSVFGRLPLNVNGQGVLIRPRRIVQFQAPSAGRILTLNLQPGAEIHRGDLLGTIDQSGLQQELQQQRDKLAELSSQTQQTSGLQRQQIALQRRTLQQQRITLERTLEDARALAPILQDKGLTALRQNRAGMELRLSQMQSQLPTLAQRVESRRQLLEAGAISQDALLQVQQEYFDRVGQVADLEAQLQQLNVKELEIEQQYLQNQGSIKQTQNDLQDLATQEAKLAQQEAEQTFNQQNQLNEVKQRIAQLELQLATQGKIISTYEGRVLEVTAVSGQIIEAGGRIGSIQAENPAEQIVSLTFFADRDGKQIEPGMSAQVTPSIAKRERFGGMVGEVTDVAPFPVTSQNIATLVGNPELAKQLAGDSAPVQIIIQLKPDANTYSGYAWTSSDGPNQKLSSGTTASVQVRVGEIAPIAYIIPLFRSWTGIY